MSPNKRNLLVIYINIDDAVGPCEGTGRFLYKNRKFIVHLQFIWKDARVAEEARLESV